MSQSPSPRKLPWVEEHISGFEFLRLAVLIFVGGMLQMAAVAMIATGCLGDDFALGGGTIYDQHIGF
jgi:hypothetical protein